MLDQEDREKKHTWYHQLVREFLLEFIRPIGKAEENKETSFEKLQESAGTDIQTVLESKDIDLNKKEFILTAATQLNGAEFQVLLIPLLPPPLPRKPDSELKITLKRINDFCVDNNVQFLVEGYGLLTHNQTRTTSRHFFWSMTTLQKFLNQDDLHHPRTPPGEPQIQGMTLEDEYWAKYLSQCMQKEAKSMIAKTCVFLGKIKLLYAAIESGDVSEVTDLLNKYKAFCNMVIDGQTPLLFAAKEGHLDVVEALLAAKADPNQARTDNGVTPLMLAAEKGHLDVVGALLAAKADPNQAATDDGATPLLLAAQGGYLDVVGALLAAKADPNQAKTDDGSTPLFFAAQRGYLDIVGALLAAKADPNQAATDDGLTPLMPAAATGRLDILRALLAAKADPNQARTDTGATPLIIAVRQGELEIVNILLEFGADPEKASHNGETPLDITPNNTVPPDRQRQIKELLQEAITNKKVKSESKKQKREENEENEDDVHLKKKRH